MAQTKSMDSRLNERARRDPKLVVKKMRDEASEAKRLADDSYEAERKREEEEKNRILTEKARRVLAQYGITADEADAIVKANEEHKWNEHFFTKHCLDYLLGLWKFSFFRKGNRYHDPTDLKKLHDSIQTVCYEKCWEQGCEVCTLVVVLGKWLELQAKLRVATKKDYDAWIYGYIKNGGKPTGLSDREFSWSWGHRDTRFASQNFNLLPLTDMKIIVGKRVRVDNLENIGKGTTLYFMDGFRVVGKVDVPVFENTLLS